MTSLREDIYNNITILPYLKVLPNNMPNKQLYYLNLFLSHLTYFVFVDKCVIAIYINNAPYNTLKRPLYVQMQIKF